MATLLGQKRIGDITIRSSDAGPVLEETWHFIVEADLPTQNRIEVASAVGLIPGVHVVDDYAVLTSLRGTQQEENPTIWDFTGEFSSEVQEGGGGGSPGGVSGADPVTWVPIYKTKYERIVEAAIKDVNGDAIASSAGEAFETGVMIPRSIPIWEFYQFEPATVSDETIIDRNETVNSATFKTKPAKSLLCTVLSSEIGLYYGQRRRLTLYQLKYNEKLWTHKRQDTGAGYLVSGVFTPFVKNGVNYIGALDGSGGKQADGTAPAILEFDIYQSINFATFLRV